MSTAGPSEPRRVVVVGGGTAGLETVLALHHLAAERVAVTLVAPELDFATHALHVAEPFARGRVARVSLGRFMAEHGGRFRRSAVRGVDTARRAVQCVAGPDEPYDALVVAVGAPAVPAFDHVLTFGPESAELDGLLLDLEQGYSRSVAFVVPPGCSWPLPLYELALMTAERARTAAPDGVAVHLVTPERTPLELFGPEGSRPVAELLAAAAVTFHGGAAPAVLRSSCVELGGGERLEVDRLVALPRLEGPRLAGLPCDADGFLPVDAVGRVAGLEDVLAAGDAADHPIKQGGLACQQADRVAEQIAADLGGGPPPGAAGAPVLRGRLLTGHGDRFLRREGAAAVLSAEPLWWPPTKVAGRHLGPYLDGAGLMDLHAHDDAPGAGVEVRFPLR